MSLPEAPAAATGANRARLAAYAILGLASLGLFVRARALPTSRWEPLGAGTFPSIILAVLAVLCVVGLAGEAMSRTTVRQGFAAQLRSHRLVIFTFAAFAVYVLLLPHLGFDIATFVFLMAVQLRLAPATRTARAVALVLAVVFSFGLSRLFADAFNIFLPRIGLLQ
ncbi:MAG TPA: tripartite tricarboxylate transporter TctB family protein [Arenibaculum sp.]|nr:tripartite tricarboxylate transporter TctB family protein [Arenibaculum sp.]